MAKDTFYFSHDYNSRTDEKIKLVIRKHGMLGYGIFWAIIEDLYNNANALRLDCDGIAFDLRVDSEVVSSIINDFDLFVFDGDTFGSLSVEKRLNERDSRSKSASEKAHIRWEIYRRKAEAMQQHSQSNAIKERKGKENKGNEKKESKDLATKTSDFYNSLIDFTEEFTQVTVRDFFNYWSEPNQQKTKLKFEMEKTWDTKKRLTTWKRNEGKFKPPQPANNTQNLLTVYDKLKDTYPTEQS